MQLSYTQGLLRGQTDPSTFAKLFLQKSGLNVSVYVTDQPLQAVVCHRGSNYLIDEKVNSASAWTCLPVACWLYWDINRSTAQVTRGVTAIAPAFGADTPVAYYASLAEILPTDDQHYFDTTALKHYYYLASSSIWIEVIRVFAASVGALGALTPMPFASQVGLNSQISAGYILFSKTSVPIIHADETFMLTSSTLAIGDASNNRLAIDIDVEPLYVLASAPLPRLSLIAPSPSGYVTADGPSGRNAIGIVLSDVAEGSLFKPQTYGIVRHDEFFFDPADTGKTVWLGPNGALLTTRPYGYIGQAVGTVVSQSAMFLNLALSLPVSIGGPTPPPAVPPFRRTKAVRAFLRQYDFNGLHETVLPVSSTGRYGIFYDGSQNQYPNWYHEYPDLVSIGWEVIWANGDGLPYNPGDTNIDIAFTPTLISIEDGFPKVEGYLTGKYKPTLTNNNYIMQLNLILHLYSITVNDPLV